jgi:parvulin-like peptidyl-prolyl isomerase
MKRSVIIAALLILTAICNYGQTKDKAVARIGKTQITQDEFSERFELMPQIGRHMKNRTAALKEELLHTLISEKLFALAAEDMKLDTMESMRYAYRSIEKMYVRDALYKIEISGKVKPTKDELLKAYFKNTVVNHVNFLFSKDKEEIYNLSKLLNQGIPFDSILAESPERFQQESPIEVKFGNMEEALEDTIYSLKPGEFSSPTETPLGWYIFRLTDRKQEIFKTPSEDDPVYRKAKQIVEDRKTDIIYNEFYKKFFGHTKITSEGPLFWSFVDKLYNNLKYIADTSSAKPDKYVLSVRDYEKIEQQIGQDSLLMILVKFDKNPSTLKDFMREFIFEGFETDSVTHEIIAGKVNSRLKRYIEGELLAREGYKRGLQNLPDVKHSLKMWRENYLSQLYKGIMRDSINVTQEESREYYSKNFKPTGKVKHVNIAEVLTDDLEVVEKVLKEAENGADMKQLAMQYTKRQWVKERNGEFGFFPVGMYGEIGKIAGELKVGEVYGPLTTPEGYSVFKLLDVKEEEIVNPAPYEQVKDSVQLQLTANKFYSKMTEEAMKLADKYGVEVDSKALDDVKVTEINMFAYRYMGFGGKITAVPVTAPFYEWYNEWKKNKKDLP